VCNKGAMRESRGRYPHVLDYKYGYVPSTNINPPLLLCAMLFRERFITLWYLIIWPAGLLSVLVCKFRHVFGFCKDEKAMKHIRFCIHNTWPYLRTLVLK